MTEILEATVNSFGQVILRDKIRLKKNRRAIVTIFDDDEPGEVSDAEWSLRGSMELVGDLEAASRKISEEMNLALEESARKLTGED